MSHSRTARKVNSGIVLVLALTACNPPSSYWADPSRAQSAMLTEIDIASVNAITAYDAVALLRPRFLRSGGGQAFAPTVYVDGDRVGAVNELELIPALSIKDIQFISAVEATSIFGTSGRSGPAIVVRTRHGR
jgi:hypothetical protein